MNSSLKLTCVYVVAQDFVKSINFYTNVLQKEIGKEYKNRWAQIRISTDLVLGILNANFDKDLIEAGGDVAEHYDINFVNNLERNYKSGNTIVLNLGTENLKEEYERIKKLNPEKISPIQYVNFMCPYRFFTIKDPDGNVIEVADSV